MRTGLFAGFRKLAAAVSDIVHVGSASNNGTTATLPAHQSGDLILGFGFRGGSTAAPTVPAGWTSVAVNSVNTGAALAYKFAASSGETSGTWSSANYVAFAVYRGASAAGAGSFLSGNSSTTVSYPGRSLAVSDGTSWIVAFSGHRSIDTSLETPPSGLTLRNNASDLLNEIAAFDSAGGVSSWVTTDVAVGGTADRWAACTIEVLA